jgi:hypothetical protein
MPRHEFLMLYKPKRMTSHGVMSDGKWYCACGSWVSDGIRKSPTGRDQWWNATQQFLEHLQGLATGDTDA